jgi:transcriptional regulator with XRE-family HTH domain
MDDAWRARLREAIKHADRKHSDVAWGAGITPVTLSRVLTGATAAPDFDTVVRIAHEVGVSVGWLLNEREFRLGPIKREQLRWAARVILDLTGE